MISKDNVINHLINNIVIYVLLVIIFFVDLYNGSFGNALFNLILLVYMGAGWFATGHFIVSIKGRDFSCSFGDILSYGYVVLFSLCWVGYYGVDRKAAFLLLPILTGIIISFAGLVTGSRAYRKLDILEKRVYRKAKKFIRNKKG